MDQLFQKMDPNNLAAATIMASSRPKRRHAGSNNNNRDTDNIDDTNASTTDDDTNATTKRCKVISSTTSSSTSSSGPPSLLLATSVNQYQGWTVPHNGFLIPTIPYESTNKDTTSSLSLLTPADFFQNYISPRRPVVIHGIPTDLSRLLQWTDTEYLIAKAGKETVLVEERQSSNDSFGQGNEVSMSFEHFVKLIQDDDEEGGGGGDDRHYLTTQNVQANEDGRPDLMAPFMKVLQQDDDFPLRPHLMGSLIPQNINLWMGRGRGENGSSSGLHHDYHDNLYIVLQGKKKFRLFGPNDAEKMYTRGKLVMVHPNGRINYEGEVTTAYGADCKSDSAARASRAKDEAEKMLLEAEEAVKEGKAGALEMLERAEEMMEDAMEALIDAEVDPSDGNCDDDEVDDEVDDDEEYDSDLDGNKVNSEDEKDEEILDTHEPRLVDKTVKNPNNFSMIDPNLLDNQKELYEKYPLMQNAKSAFCEVQAGQMLYLPASWFHEVRSLGCDGGHLALNYWFHPPDASDFERPYSSDFWPNDYRERFEDCFK